MGMRDAEPAVRALADAAEPLAWDARWGGWLAQMPVEVARELVRLRAALQDALDVFRAATAGRVEAALGAREGEPE